MEKNYSLCQWAQNSEFFELRQKKKYTKKNKYRLTCHLSLTKDCSPLSDRVTDGQPQY